MLLLIYFYICLYPISKVIFLLNEMFSFKNFQKFIMEDKTRGNIKLQFGLLLSYSLIVFSLMVLSVICGA